MIESQNIRQILAIMVTDIVDYTETMNNDEQKAWEYLKKQRTLIPPMISKMNGHIFKEMGDGTFSKFKSAIDAVHCAVKIQEEAINNELPIRISVHLGDVMDDGVDVIGTGVNIASRINSLAKTGSIVISEDVWRQVRNQADLDATSMGQKEIKGFHQAVEVFELTFSPDGSVTKKVKVTETVTITDEDGKKVQAETAKKEFIKKVAVFPFDYDGDDNSLDYLKYGFPFGCCVSLLQDPLVELEFPNKMELQGESFINELRKAGYERGEGVPLPLKKKIAKELHCDFFIFGSIKLIDNDKQITSRVYSTKNGKLVNESIINGEDIFQLIDEFSIQIRKDLGIPHSHIDEIENLSFSEIITDSENAYKNFINGSLTMEYNNDYAKSFNFFQEAIQIDPTFSLGNFSLSWCCFLSNNEDYSKEGIKAMNGALNHIYKLPPRLSFLIKKYNYMWYRGEPDKAEKVIQMWIRQFPDSITPLRHLADIFQSQQKFIEAIKIYKDILEKNSEEFNFYLNLTDCYLILEDYDTAQKYAELYLDKCPTEGASYKVLGTIYSKKGDYEAAKDYYEQALILESGNSNYMVFIGKAELALGNFSEAKNQLEEALTFCKTNQDYATVYNAFYTFYNVRGEINQSIKFSDKSVHQEEKYMNPIDTVLSRIMGLMDYVLIGESDTALTKLKDEKLKLVHPWNLLAGFGEIVIGGIVGDKVILQSGIKSVEEFLKIKDFGWLRRLPKFGLGLYYFIEKKYDDAIYNFEEGMKDDAQGKDAGIPWLLKCYYHKKDFEGGIKIAHDYLKHTPMATSILLELVKFYIAINERDKAKEKLTKLLNIWENADEEYIYFQEAKKLWKELNTVKEPA